MGLDIDKLDLKFSHCNNCNTLVISLGYKFLEYNTGSSSLDSIIFKFNDTEYDVTNSVLKLLTDHLYTNTVNIINGDAIINGNNTLFTKEYNVGDFIGFDISGKVYFYKITEIVSDTALRVSIPIIQPDSAGVRYYKVNPVFELDASFNDDLYKVRVFISTTYFSTGNEDMVEYVKDIILYCNASCCFDKMVALLPSKLCNDCETSSFVSDLMLLESLLKGIEYSICCPDDKRLKEMLALVNKICKYNNCETC